MTHVISTIQEGLKSLVIYPQTTVNFTAGAADSRLKRAGHEWREVLDRVDEPDHKDERHCFAHIPDFTPLAHKQWGDEGVVEYVNHIREGMDKAFAQLAGGYEEQPAGAHDCFGIRGGNANE